MERALGRLEPTDWEHVAKYPLRALEEEETPVGQPVVIGVNWYEAFDRPERGTDGSWWIGRYGDLGRVRGGHALCLRPDRLSDYGTWHEFYDQGQEGACVGFACSRMQTIRNRRRYDAFWTYHEAQKLDEWEGEDYEGTSVRAGLEVLRTQGLMRVGSTTPDYTSGILAYRWLTSVDEVREVLASPTNDARGAVRFLNSWGTEWPHFTWMSYGVLERLLDEYGEIATATDR